MNYEYLVFQQSHPKNPTKKSRPRRSKVIYQQQPEYYVKNEHDLEYSPSPMLHSHENFELSGDSHCKRPKTTSVDNLYLFQDNCCDEHESFPTTDNQMYLLSNMVHNQVDYPSLDESIFSVQNTNSKELVSTDVIYQDKAEEEYPINRSEMLLHNQINHDTLLRITINTNKVERFKKTKIFYSLNNLRNMTIKVSNEQILWKHIVKADMNDTFVRAELALSDHPVPTQLDIVNNCCEEKYPCQTLPIFFYSDHIVVDKYGSGSTCIIINFTKSHVKDRVNKYTYLRFVICDANSFHHVNSDWLPLQFKQRSKK